jgi:cysteine desulfurase/selenocysteine lyase
LFGFHESLKFHESIDKKKISNDILSLRNYAIERLKELNSVEIYGEKSKSSFSIINFNLRGINAHDVVDYLGSKNVFVRAGNFCCPLLCELIGVNSSIRVSFSVYNNKSDVDLLVSSLKELSLNNDLIYFFNH